MAVHKSINYLFKRQPDPLIDRVAEQAGLQARRGFLSVRETSRNLLDHASRISNSAVNYVKDEPVNSMLIAATASIVLTAIFSSVLQARSRL